MIKNVVSWLGESLSYVDHFGLIVRDGRVRDEEPAPPPYEFLVSKGRMAIRVHGASRPWFYLRDFSIQLSEAAHKRQRYRWWIGQYGEPGELNDKEVADAIAAEWRDPPEGNPNLPIWDHPSWDARTCADAAYSEFGRLLSIGEVTLWARWRSMQSPFEPLPPDAWPVHPDLFCKAKKLDFANGWIELASGERVYSLHIVRNDQRAETTPSSRTAGGEKRLANWFSDIVDRYPALRVLTNDDLKAQALRFGASKEAVARARATVLATKSDAIAAVWKHSGRLSKEADAIRRGLIKGAD